MLQPVSILLLGGVFVIGLAVSLLFGDTRSLQGASSLDSAKPPVAASGRAVGFRDTAAVRPRLESATRDPFSPPAGEQPPPPKAAVVQQAPAAPLAETVPAAPPLNLKFLGRVRKGDGSEGIFVALDQANLELSPGLALPNGYVVKAVEKQAIEFVHAASGATERLVLPEWPAYEVR